MISPDQIVFATHDIHPNPVIGKPHIPGGCGWYRCFLPMSVIGASTMGYPAYTSGRGFGVKVGTNKARFGYKTAVLKLLMERNVAFQIGEAQKVGQRIVIDLDDWYEDIPTGNLANIMTSSERSKVRNRDAYMESIPLADTITVATPFLLERYSEIHPDVRMVRNGVYLPQFIKRRTLNIKPVVGWCGAVPWKLNDLEQLNVWLPDFLTEHDLMFHHSGAMEGLKTFSQASGVPPERITTLPLAPIDTFGALFPPIDIGIIPLQVDHDFNRAKSFIRGLEMAASGVPFIASPTDEYKVLAGDGIGRLANTPDEWVAECTRLLDFTTRKKDVARNYAGVRERHTIQARKAEWQAALLD